MLIMFMMIPRAVSPAIELARSHMITNKRPDNVIVATSSEAGFHANHFSPFYAASKFAVSFRTCLNAAS